VLGLLEEAAGDVPERAVRLVRAAGEEQAAALVDDEGAGGGRRVRVVGRAAARTLGAAGLRA
jgi:hypothetical protein